MTELDPVVAYDVMREASARLMGLYAGQITTGGPADPAIAEMRKVRAEARAIDTHDAAAQAAATADFRAKYMRLKNDGTDDAESADRARKVRDAVACARLEGVVLRAEYLALLEAYARGKITAEELLKRTSL